MKNLKSSEERLCDKETETEILKNRLRDQNTECERLRESLQSLQSSSINNSNGGGMEQKVIFKFLHKINMSKILEMYYS